MAIEVSLWSCKIPRKIAFEVGSKHPWESDTIPASTTGSSSPRPLGVSVHQLRRAAVPGSRRSKYPWREIRSCRILSSGHRSPVRMKSFKTLLTLEAQISFETGNPHRIGIIGGEDISEVSRGNADIDLLAALDLSRSHHLLIGRIVIDDLRSQPSPVDRIGGREPEMRRLPVAD